MVFILSCMQMSLDHTKLDEIITHYKLLLNQEKYDIRDYYSYELPSESESA